MNSLSIGIFQMDSVWEDVFANRQKIEELLKNLDTKPDILLLPEMYSTGFVLSPGKINQEQLKNQRSWQIKQSFEYQIAIMGSVISPSLPKYHNRMLLTQPDGAVDIYDKRHLFLIEQERGFFIPGKKRKIFNIGGINMMPQICYDLRFPVWSRNDLNYKVLIYAANWPEVRQDVWTSLLKARAIENQAYVVGVNRVGEDKNNISYIGGSQVYSAKGEKLLQMDNSESYNHITLDIDELDRFRNKFPVHKDADNFTIEY